MRLNFIVLVAISGAVAGCSRGPAKISISNGASVTVSNVQILGEHFSQPLGSMTPGMSMSFAPPRGDDKLHVVFEADGQAFDSVGKARPSYFEVSSRHPLALTIGADLQVAASSGAKSN